MAICLSNQHECGAFYRVSDVCDCICDARRGASNLPQREKCFCFFGATLSNEKWVWMGICVVGQIHLCIWCPIPVTGGDPGCKPHLQGLGKDSLLVKPTHHAAQVLADLFYFEFCLLPAERAQHGLIRLIF